MRQVCALCKGSVHDHFDGDLGVVSTCDICGTSTPRFSVPGLEWLDELVPPSNEKITDNTPLLFSSILDALPDKEYEIGIANSVVKDGECKIESVISLIEEHLRARVPEAGPRLTRCAALSLSSAFTSNIVLKNRYGSLKPNIWTVFIAESGEGKSLVNNAMEEIIDAVAPDLKLPSKNTPSGFADMVRGSMKSSDGYKEAEYGPRENGIILFDEFSSLVEGIANPWQHGAFEFWQGVVDGYIEAQAYSSTGFRPKVPVYCSAFGSATSNLLHDMDDSAFTRGFGLRIDWIVEEMSRRDLTEEEYFSLQPEETLSIVKDELIKLLPRLSKPLGVYFTPDAKKAFVRYWNDIRRRKPELGQFERSYRDKMAGRFNKYAILHAAGRGSIDEE